MIVCICRRVSDHEIRRAAADGATSLDCLKRELGVATGCGRCADCASDVLCAARTTLPIGIPIVRVERLAAAA